MLWGANAQGLMDDLITCAAVHDDGGKVVRENLINKAYILSSHPSPLSCRRLCKGSPPFVGSKPFSTANELLVNMGGTEIDWTL